METILSAKNIRYMYPDGTFALEDVSLDVGEGESIAILGPNGAGKSTLLKILAGIIESEGTVEICGKTIGDLERKKVIESVGIVFQDPDDQLFMPTVYEDVSFGPLNMGLSPDEVSERSIKALAEMGLEEYRERTPNRMSFGEKKKASIATVLSMDPEIYLFDEPTANLDPKSRKTIIKTIKSLKQKGKTIITTTHDVNYVPEIADRIIILDGSVTAHGTPGEIFFNPELLKESNLEVPAVTVLFELLKCFGLECSDVPLTLDEAFKHLTKTIETGGGHIHLHIHEHTHDKWSDLREKHGHH